MNRKYRLFFVTPEENRCDKRFGKQESEDFDYLEKIAIERVRKEKVIGGIDEIFTDFGVGEAEYWPEGDKVKVYYKGTRGPREIHI